MNHSVDSELAAGEVLKHIKRGTGCALILGCFIGACAILYGLFSPVWQSIDPVVRGSLVSALFSIVKLLGALLLILVGLIGLNLWLGTDLVKEDTGESE